jgi:putative sigma-54 modulation protein
MSTATDLELNFRSARNGAKEGIGGEMIPFEIRSKEGATDEIREYAERRVCFALDRFRDMKRVVVSLDDLNGPKGGMDKLCRIVAEFGFASVVVEEVQMDWHAAIAGATHRLSQKVARELKRANRRAARAMQHSREDTSRDRDLREAR